MSFTNIISKYIDLTTPHFFQNCFKHYVSMSSVTCIIKNAAYYLEYISTVAYQELNVNDRRNRLFNLPKKNRIVCDWCRVGMAIIEDMFVHIYKFSFIL